MLPLHNPIRLAEDAATLAIMSQGRFDLGVGAGYLPSNYAAFGQSLRRRGALMEEGLSILRRAWSGESVAREGTCWTLPDVVVQPLPAPGNEPRLFVGGFTPRAIERAARFGDGFACGLPSSIETYLDALDTLGKPRDSGKIAMMQWWVIAEDPQRTWARIGTHALYQVNKYIATGGFEEDMEPYETADELLERGHYTLYDGPTAVRELSALLERVPQIVNMQLYGLLPGEPVESGMERMEYRSKGRLAPFRLTLALPCTRPMGVLSVVVVTRVDAADHRRRLAVEAGEPRPGQCESRAPAGSRATPQDRSYDRLTGNSLGDSVYHAALLEVRGDAPALAGTVTDPCHTAFEPPMLRRRNDNGR